MAATAAGGKAIKVAALNPSMSSTECHNPCMANRAGGPRQVSSSSCARGGLACETFLWLLINF